MARLVLGLLAVLPVFALAMDQWGLFFCPAFKHDGSDPASTIAYSFDLGVNQPLRLYCAAEPVSGKNISCMTMTLAFLKGVSVTYNFNNVQQPIVTSDSYDVLNILYNYKFNNVVNNLFGASSGGTGTLTYTGKYNGTYYVYKNCFQGFLMYWIRTYVFVANNFNATTHNFTDFQQGFQAKYGVTLDQKIMC